MHRMAIMRDDLSSGRPVNYRVGLFVWVPNLRDSLKIFTSNNVKITGAISIRQALGSHPVLV